MDKYQQIKEAFELLRDDENAVHLASYMRYQFKFYGIQTPERRAVYKSVLDEAKKIRTIDWNLLEECWKDEHREFQYFVADYLNTMRKYLTYDDVPKIERFIRSKQWWDTIDGLDRTIGQIAFRDNRINDLMLRWAEDEDFWVRRIAIDHQLCRKHDTNEELLEAILVKKFRQQRILYQQGDRLESARLLKDKSGMGEKLHRQISSPHEPPQPPRSKQISEVKQANSL